MVMCPYCKEDKKNLGSHIMTAHPEFKDKAPETTPTKKVDTKGLMARSLKRLEEQNELLLLQFQQNSLLRALQTGELPEPKREGSSIKESIKLIKEIQGLSFGDGEEEVQEEDLLVKEGINILKQYIASKTQPPQPTQPIPQPINLEEEEYSEVEEDVENANGNDLDTGSGVLGSSKSNGEEPKTTSEAKQ